MALGRCPQPIAEMDEFVAWLLAHIPLVAHDESKVSIVHSDVGPDNLMFHASERRVIGIAPAETALRGLMEDEDIGV